MSVLMGRFGAADRGLLPEGRLTGPMPWVLAIMMFLTVLAAAAGLALHGGARILESQIGSGITIQVIEANPDSRDIQASRAEQVLRASPAVRNVRRVGAEEIRELLEPWLGEAGAESDLPIPAMIDAELVAGGDLATVRASVQRVAPAARVDDNAQWLAPLARLIDALRWLAIGLVLLMVGATAATVVLAARASLDTHRSTIEVLHLMGATDLQVARIFQRRIALDALFGGLLGLAAASLVMVAIGDRVRALGSELIGSAALADTSWLILAALPIAGVLLATLVARATILRALSRLL